MSQVRKGSGCQRRELLGKQLAGTRNGNAGSCSWARFPLNVAERSREQHIRQRLVRESPCRAQGRSRGAFQLRPSRHSPPSLRTDRQTESFPRPPSSFQVNALQGLHLVGIQAYSASFLFSLKPFQTLLGPLFLPGSNSTASSPPSTNVLTSFSEQMDSGHLQCFFLHKKLWAWAGLRPLPLHLHVLLL